MRVPKFLFYEWPQKESFSCHYKYIQKMWSNRERFSMLLINQDDIQKKGFAVERPQSWMNWFPLFLYGYGTTLCMQICLHIYRITGINQRKLLRKIAQKDWFSSFLNPLPNSSFRRQGLTIAFKWLFWSMQKTSSLRLSASRIVLGNDLLQICSPECSFWSKWWVGIGLGLIGSLSPAHTESMNFGYTELRLTCS